MTLPTEIIVKLVGYLNDESRASLRSSCKAAYDIVRSTVQRRKKRLFEIGGLVDEECWGCDNYLYFQGKPITVRECTCAGGPSNLFCNENISPPSHQELMWEIQRPITHLIWEIEGMFFENI